MALRMDTRHQRCLRQALHQRRRCEYPRVKSIPTSKEAQACGLSIIIGWACSVTRQTNRGTCRSEHDAKSLASADPAAPEGFVACLASSGKRRHPARGSRSAIAKGEESATGSLGFDVSHLATQQPRTTRATRIYHHEGTVSQHAREPVSFLSINRYGDRFHPQQVIPVRPAWVQPISRLQGQKPGERILFASRPPSAHHRLLESLDARGIIVHRPTGGIRTRGVLLVLPALISDPARFNRGIHPPGIITEPPARPRPQTANGQLLRHVHRTPRLNRSKHESLSDSCSSPREHPTVSPGSAPLPATSYRSRPPELYRTLPFPFGRSELDPCDPLALAARGNLAGLAVLVSVVHRCLSNPQDPGRTPMGLDQDH